MKVSNVSIPVKQSLRKISKSRKDFDTPGDYLRYLRQERDLTQAGLEKELGLTPKIVSKWETGRHEISKQFRPILADFFGVAEEDFAGGFENEIENLEHEVSEIVRRLDLHTSSEPSRDALLLRLEVAELMIRLVKESLKDLSDE